MKEKEINSGQSCHTPMTPSKFVYGVKKGTMECSSRRLGYGVDDRSSIPDGHSVDIKKVLRFMKTI